MKFMEENMREKPLFIIEEKPDVIQGQPEGETPVITIETDADEPTEAPPQPKPRRRLPWILATAFATAVACLCIVGGCMYYLRYVDIGVPVSQTSGQNIAKLQRKHPRPARPAVVMTSDSILGVGMNFYELRDLRAGITFVQPDTADTDVYLYSRCSDFTSYDKAENHYLGSLVVAGEELESDNSRLGYCAMADGNIVIGIARNERVKDYCIDRGGDFFRQFVLVSAGVLPSRFYLHGKVERRAIGRIGDKLYYIESRNKEALWAFADAIREYGFVDAIYITGGTDYCFYRDADGCLHDIGDTSGKGARHKGDGIVPWLVFRRR